MRKRLLRPFLLAILAVVGVLLLSATPSAAGPLAWKPYETNYGVPAPSGYPDDWQCDDLIGIGCFEFYGDRWWIYDIVYDNGELRVEWQNQLWNGSSWENYRHGRCVATVEDEWQVCNKDYYESTSTNEHGYKGSRVRWQLCDWQDYCWSWTPWYNNNR